MCKVVLLGMYMNTSVMFKEIISFFNFFFNLSLTPTLFLLKTEARFQILDKTSFWEFTTLDRALGYTTVVPAWKSELLKLIDLTQPFSSTKTECGRKIQRSDCNEECSSL